MTTSDSSTGSDKGGFLDSAIEKGGDFVDKKTGDKYKSQVDKGQDFLSDKYGSSGKSEQTRTSGDADDSTGRGN